MVGLALVTLSTVVQGVHCLTVKTMFCFNLSSPNEDEYCSLGWLLRIQRMNTAVWVGYNSSLRMLDLGLSLIFDVRTCFCKNKYRTSSSSASIPPQEQMMMMIFYLFLQKQGLRGHQHLRAYRERRASARTAAAKASASITASGADAMSMGAPASASITGEDR